jgi:hypothetical protein
MQSYLHIQRAQTDYKQAENTRGKLSCTFLISSSIYRQIGASCPTLNVTPTGSGNFTAPFSVKYGPIPFTINEVYAAVSTTLLPGMFIKTCRVPGGQFLQLPTAVVDTALDATGAIYERLTMYSCIDILGAIPIVELAFFTRSASWDAAVQSDMESIARKVGVTWDEKQLNYVDRSKQKC